MKRAGLLILIGFMAGSILAESKIQEGITTLQKDSLYQKPDSLVSGLEFSVILKETDFMKGFCASPFELIQGKIPGLNVSGMSGRPGTDFGSFYQGINSFEMNQPLVLINQVPQFNRTVVLNPDDIESISFLTDGFLTGAGSLKTANGILSITTKKGTESLSIAYSSEFALSYLPSKAHVLTADEFRKNISSYYTSQPSIIELMGESETDWQDVIYQKALAMKHQISLSGTVKKIGLPYRISLDDVDQEGILKTDDYHRSGARLAIHPTFFKNHLKVTAHSQFFWFKNRIANESAIANALRFDPTQPLYESNNYGNYFTYMLGELPLSGTLKNPLALLEQTRQIEKSHFWNQDIRAEYNFHFLPELQWVFQQSFQKSDFDSNNSISKEASWVYPLGVEEVSKSTLQSKTSYYESYVSFSKQLNSIATHIQFQLGGTLSKFENKSQTNSSRTQTEESTYQTFYVNSLLNLHNTLSLNVNVQRQISSYFNESNRKNWYPSASLIWNLKNAKAFQKVTFISGLTLFTSYELSSLSWVLPPAGLSSFNLPTGTSSDSYNFGSSYYNNYRPEFIDAVLKPESVSSLSAGIHMGTFNNRISANLKFYQNQSHNLFSWVNVPTSTTFNNYLLTNIGELTNKGMSLRLNALLVQKKHWNWAFSSHVNFNQNRLTKMGINGYEIDSLLFHNIVGGVSIPVMIHSIDHSVNQFHTYEQVYNNDGTPAEGIYTDKNKDGIITIEDLVIHKKSTPDWILGISSQLNYKNWELSFSGRLIAGHSIYNNLASVSYYHSFYNSQFYLLNCSDDIEKSKFENPQYLSDYYIRDATFFRLDYISLGYSFKKVLLKKIDVNLAATLQNVFVLSHYNGQDPENFTGVEYSQYPRPRMASFKIQMMF